jgi:ankyrin repeat protein
LLHLQDGVTALMLAYQDGHLDVARLLLDRGAKVDATHKVGC